ncbi:hypothetical protein B0H14DRAFT_3742141, partial [Mycena olivaceomarginata]
NILSIIHLERLWRTACCGEQCSIARRPQSESSMSEHKQSVWSKEIQYAFVQGPRLHFDGILDAPFATHTLGRSGLDQFIVEYLQGLDIVRTKKQVASRMQVLRERMR